MNIKLQTIIKPKGNTMLKQTLLGSMIAMTLSSSFASDNNEINRTSSLNGEVESMVENTDTSQLRVGVDVLNKTTGQLGAKNVPLDEFVFELMIDNESLVSSKSNSFGLVDITDFAWSSQSMVTGVEIINNVPTSIYSEIEAGYKFHLYESEEMENVFSIDISYKSKPVIKLRSIFGIEVSDFEQKEHTYSSSFTLPHGKSNCGYLTRGSKPLRYCLSRDFEKTI